jgi:Tol biopolymer transport system component
MALTVSRTAATGILALALAACQDAPLAPKGQPTGPINVSVQAAPTDFVRCGEEIPVTVTVTGANRRALSGYLVNFNVLEGGGRMFGGAALTNRNGVAKDIWTVGSVGHVANTLAVRAVDRATGRGTTYLTQTVRTRTQIAFQRLAPGGSQGDVFVMDADGSNLRNLTNNPAQRGFDPAWSPDGRRIAFSGGPAFRIRVMNADGSNLVELTTTGNSHFGPAWSPDGSTIAYSRSGGIYRIDPDGSNDQQLTSTGEQSPTWSPDGSRIASSRLEGGGLASIYVMDAHGLNLTRLTNVEARDQRPRWSPGGSQILFSSSGGRGTGTGYFTMQANGANIRHVVSGGPTASWSPDGSRIAFSNDGIHTVGPDGSAIQRLTDNANDSSPAWSGCAL